MHLFNISTSKGAPRLKCFVHFDFEVRFAPQRRSYYFEHLNFQQWSEPTAACNFSSLIWRDGSAPAALATYFSTLWSHKSLEKRSVSRLSYLFAHLHLLSSDSFSSLIFFLLLFSSLLYSSAPPLLFHLSILSVVWSSVHHEWDSQKNGKQTPMKRLGLSSPFMENKPCFDSTLA